MNEIRKLIAEAFNQWEETNAQTPVTHKSPPKGYPNDKAQYADPANYKYPIDSKQRVLSAWRYINQEKNQKGYSPSQVAAIKSRIKSAAKKYGLKLQEGNAVLYI